MAIPQTISGFSIIPVTYTSSTTHYLYARPHRQTSSKNPELKKRLPDGRTLFLVNVPPDASERDVVLFFKHGGTVERVLFDFDVGREGGGYDGLEGGESSDEDGDGDGDEGGEDDGEEDATAAAGEDGERPRKRRKGDKKHDKEAAPPPKVVPLPTLPLRTLRNTGRTAHVVFLDSSSLERALASTSKPRAWPLPGTTEEPLGLEHYKTQYATLRPPLDAVKAYADSSMEVYEYALAKEKAKLRSQYRKGEAIVDDDGFTLVTRGGAYGKNLGGGVGVASKRFQRSGETTRNRGDKEKKKKEKEKEGFYGFQKAEKQRSELLELKRKWEEDKAKIEKLKASRRFKPY